MFTDYSITVTIYCSVGRKFDTGVIVEWYHCAGTAVEEAPTRGANATDWARRQSSLGSGESSGRVGAGLASIASSSA